MTEDSMHRTLDAALARNSGPSAEDVEALAAELGEMTAVSWDFFPEPDMAIEDVARHALASDWLAAHTAAAKARGVNNGIRLAAHLVRDHVLGETGERVADFLLARAARAAAAREGGA